MVVAAAGLASCLNIQTYYLIRYESVLKKCAIFWSPTDTATAQMFENNYKNKETYIFSTEWVPTMTCFLGIILPLILTCVFYRKASKGLHVERPSSSGNDRAFAISQKKKKTVAKMVFRISVVTCFIALPSIIYDVVLSYVNPEMSSLFRNITFIFEHFPLLHSCVAPIFYAGQQERVKRLFCRFKMCNRNPAQRDGSMEIKQ